MATENGIQVPVQSAFEKKPELTDEVVRRQPKISRKSSVAIEVLEVEAGVSSTIALESPAALEQPVEAVPQERLIGRYAAVAGYCCASLIAGIFLASMPKWNSPPVIESVAEKPLVYVATNARRAEPISPIVPFADLDPAIISLGRRLFHDPQLSANGKTACNTCHQLSAGGDDGLPVSASIGGSRVAYNTPTIYNAALNFAQFWDGRSDTLEEQLDDHFQIDGPMGANWQRVLKALKLDPFYNRSFQLEFGSEPTEQSVRSAITNFERSLVTTDSRFDQWLQGKQELLSGDELGGYYLFKKLNCISCHQGAGVGGSMLQSTASIRKYFEDKGSSTSKLPDVMRVPSLRNVDLTAPYFHDGSVATLEEAVQVMIEHQLGHNPNPVDVQRISAFLRTLNGKVINAELELSRE